MMDARTIINVVNDPEGREDLKYGIYVKQDSEIRPFKMDNTMYMCIENTEKNMKTKLEWAQIKLGISILIGLYSKFFVEGGGFMIG